MMPKLMVVGGCDEAEAGWRCGSGDGVERTGAIATSYHASGSKVLYRKTKRVKFNGNKVINSELTNK
jgi:hypothetical protein